MVQILKTQCTPPTLLAIENLSPVTQCELKATLYAEDDHSFQREQLVRHQGRMAQVTQDSRYLFRAYTQAIKDLSYERGWDDDDCLARTHDALLSAIFNDTDPDRRQIITDYIKQFGCQDPVWFSILLSIGEMPLIETHLLIRSAKMCYDDLLAKARHDYDTDTVDKANTTSSVPRTMNAMKFLGENATLISGPVNKVLIVGAGLDFVPFGFMTAAPSQIQEPFLVMDAVLNYFAVSLDDLNIDVADINPRVIQHLESAKERTQHGEPYSLFLHWDQQSDVKGDPPVAHVPLRDRTQINREEKTYHSRFLNSIYYTLYWDRVDLDPQALSHIHPRQCDIVNDAAGDAEHYDLIIMLHVGHYLDNTERMMALDNMSHALRPGGLLFTDGWELEMTQNDACHNNAHVRLVRVADDGHYDARRKLYLLQKQ